MTSILYRRIIVVKPAHQMQNTTIVVDGVQYTLHVCVVRNEHDTITGFQVVAFEIAKKDCKGQLLMSSIR